MSRIILNPAASKVLFKKDVVRVQALTVQSLSLSPVTVAVAVARHFFLSLRPQLEHFDARLAHIICCPILSWTVWQCRLQSSP